MKTVKIITAKIREDIFDKVRSGEKRFELRTETFEHADVIRYVSDKLPNRFLGMYHIGSEKMLPNDKDSTDFNRTLACVDAVDFASMFPQYRFHSLYSVTIGKPVVPGELFEERNERRSMFGPDAVEGEPIGEFTMARKSPFGSAWYVETLQDGLESSTFELFPDEILALAELVNKDQEGEQ